jgi:uncharacterized protein with HEPN domain
MKRDQAYFFDIAEAAKLAVSYVDQTTKEAFLSDTKSQDSVIRRLEIIGEAAKRISEETRNAHADFPWKEMIGMRNFLIHDYDDIDIHIVWRTVTKDLPDLLSKMKNAGLLAL